MLPFQIARMSVLVLTVIYYLEIISKELFRAICINLYSKRGIYSVVIKPDDLA